jgi:hypothetical protein
VRVLVQWATATVADWVTYDINRIQDVRAMPKKPRPSDSPVIDNSAGWVAALNIQGIVFTGYDVIGFTYASGALRVHCRNDGPDFAANQRWGQVWELQSYAPDPRFPVPNPDPNPSWQRGLVGGVMCYVNTRQSVTWYGEPQSDPVTQGVPGVLPFASMPMPTNPNDILYGVWVSDAQWAALSAARSPKSWREMD